MINYADEDFGIVTLLELHGEILAQEDGYWIKIEAWRTAPSEGVPHGVRYSLTLHEPYGKRILGYETRTRQGHPESSNTQGYASPTTIGTGMLVTRAYRTSSVTHTSCCRTSSRRSIAC